MNEAQRLRDVQRFYLILERLEKDAGGKRYLATCSGQMNWPSRGVYFFFEPGELRTTTGTGPRVVRVGTHGLKRGSRSTLWGRLRQHRGTTAGKHPGGGNHRGSVFRLHVGTALLAHDRWPAEIAQTWAVGSNATREIRDREFPLEKAVSRYIGRMPFLWLRVADEPGPGSLRGTIECNAIALLSNAVMPVIDPPSPDWLGRWAANEAIPRSGLWNVDHTTKGYDASFLDVLKRLVAEQASWITGSV